MHVLTWQGVRVWGPKGLIPFYAYLNKFFRKTLAPREGDAHNISSYGKNLLYALTPSEPEFSVFDYIWEKIKSISESPQKCCWPLSIRTGS